MVKTNPRPVVLAKWLVLFLPYVIALCIGGLFLSAASTYKSQKLSYETKIAKLEASKTTLQGKLDDISQELDAVKKEDQFVTNRNLEAEIKNIRSTYDDAVHGYEDLLKLKEMTPKTAKLDQQFAETLTYLSRRNYASASATLAALTRGIKDLRDSITATFVIPSNVPVNNAPPAGGFSRQSVNSDAGQFQVDLIAGDLGSTRVIVDSASDSDCHNDCPVLPLGEYVARNGGYAGINGSYFCPATYPSCADKKNSFDTLLMNVRKNYLQSDNNVYSTVPAVVFLGSSVRFVSQSLQWGRDTGGDGVLANQPLLVSGGSVVFGGDGDPKKGSKGPRSFVANKGNTVYIGVVYNATVAEAARVAKALGFDNALNLDSGGSTALWHNGYKVGPGRNIPNAIIFKRR
jgi:hypothetical protein